MNFKIDLEKVDTLPNGKKVYIFYFSFGTILSQVSISANSAKEALELASSGLQFELMHAGLQLLDWKESIENV